MFDDLRQALEQRPKSDGIASSEIVTLPEPLAKALNAMLRKGPRSLTQLAGEFGLSLTETGRLVDLLVGKGILVLEARAEDGETIYRVRLARTRELKARPEIWKALDDKN
jgi:DNA-binding MarR family transcriptional regulator